MRSRNLILLCAAGVLGLATTAFAMTPTPMPEPSSLLLLAAGALGAIALRRIR